MAEKRGSACAVPSDYNKTQRLANGVR